MYIVKFPNGEYQYHRRNTGRQYESRMARGPDIKQARVFPTLAAAKNSDGIRTHNGAAVPVSITEAVEQ